MLWSDFSMIGILVGLMIIRGRGELGMGMEREVCVEKVLIDSMC